MTDREALGIPADAAVLSGSNDLAEGWTMAWIGIRVSNPPPRPWPWPHMMLRRGRRVWMLVQIWSETLSRPGFMHNVRWHPNYGRTYTANGRDPGDLPQLIREAQRLMLRETRGRKRKRPSPELFIADRGRIRHANGGIEPSDGRMAAEYGVRTSTVKRWLQRPNGRASGRINSAPNISGTSPRHWRRDATHHSAASPLRPDGRGDRAATESPSPQEIFGGIRRNKPPVQRNRWSLSDGLRPAPEVLTRWLRTAPRSGRQPLHRAPCRDSAPELPPLGGSA
jgi:hypothetical protein